MADLQSLGALKEALQDGDAEIKLDARHVNFFYGDFQALHDAALSVRARRITALIGPSGCGKTTFLRIFNRMHDLTPGTRATGEVLLDGHNVLSSDTDVIRLRRQVGMQLHERVGVQGGHPAGLRARLVLREQPPGGEVQRVGVVGRLGRGRLVDRHEPG